MLLSLSHFTISLGSNLIIEPNVKYGTWPSSLGGSRCCTIYNPRFESPIGPTVPQRRSPASLGMQGTRSFRWGTIGRSCCHQIEILRQPNRMQSLAMERTRLRSSSGQTRRQNPRSGTRFWSLALLTSPRPLREGRGHVSVKPSLWGTT
jgi:hypothetical protein